MLQASVSMWLGVGCTVQAFDVREYPGVCIARKSSQYLCLRSNSVFSFSEKEKQVTVVTAVVVLTKTANSL